MQTIALLIDADGTAPQALDAVVAELSARGCITPRRAFGNWSRACRGWQKVFTRHAIEAQQQFHGAADKNATPIALAIAAVELLHSRECDAVALVSGDADFTPLAIHLRSAGKQVFGFGGRGTPESFRRSCDEFFCLDHPEPASKPSRPEPRARLKPEQSPRQEPPSSSPEPQLVASVPISAAPRPVVEYTEDALHDALKLVAEKKKQADGYTLLSDVSVYLHRVHPQHRLSYAGHAGLRSFIETYPSRYEQKVESSDNGEVFLYRLVGQPTMLPPVHLARVHVWLRSFAKRAAAADGFAPLEGACQYLLSQAAAESKSIDMKHYGHSALSHFLMAYPQLYELREEEDDEASTFFYKCRPKPKRER